MGLDVNFYHPEKIVECNDPNFCDPHIATIPHEMNFPHVCGFHLFRDLNILSDAPRNMFGFEPNGTLMAHIDLPFSWYSNMTPEQVVEQYRAYKHWLDQRDLTDTDEDIEARSCLEMLKYAVQQGYGTLADY